MDKTFLDYLAESEKTYEFVIRFAGNVDKISDQNKIKYAIERYDVKNFEKVSRSPIQENPLYFPQAKNCEVTTFNVTLMYPTTRQVLQKYLSEVLQISETHLLVTSQNEPFEELISPLPSNDSYEPLLTNPTLEDADHDAQADVGQLRVMELLKELEKDRQENAEFSPTAGTHVGESGDISDQENSTSVIGN